MFIFLFLFSGINQVYASNNVKAKIGNQFFDTLEEAIMAAGSNDVISLTTDIKLKESLEIKKTVNIDLNNHNIETTEKVFMIQGGSLELTGTGTIRETKPNYGAIMLKGSDDPNKEQFSTVNIGKDITLEGWSGIFIDHENKTGYGILVNVDGKINAVNDVNGGTGIGVYVNGNIQHENNSPIVNLSKNAKITSTGNGIYAAGYATYNINGAYISGEEAGLGIKSGVFNINSGTIIGTGEDKTPTSGNNNGINASGAAVQIESNPGYKGNIELNIKNGNIKSKKSNVIYEYVVNGADTRVKSINLSGGNYISDVKKDVFRLSDSFKTNHPNFISGGSYSSDPTSFLKTNYSASKNKDNLYEVTASTMLTFSQDDNNNSMLSIIVTISLIILSVIVYLKREKIISLIKKA